MGHRVVGLTCPAGRADHRGDVDDPAVAAVEHVLQDGPGQVERPGQVDVDDVVPFLGTHLAHRLVHRDAGVVDQDVQLPVPLEHLGDDPLAVLVAADVALVDAHAVVGVLVAELLGRVPVGRVPGRDLHAAVHQPFADGQPDPADSSGDQGDLAVHFCHGVTSVRCRAQAAPQPNTYSPGASARAGCFLLP